MVETLSSLEMSAHQLSSQKEAQPHAARIGRYNLGPEIGSGACGCVKLGVSDAGERVAVKILRKDACDDRAIRREITVRAAPSLASCRAGSAVATLVLPPS